MASNKKKQEPVVQTDAEAQKIDAIRNILFGQQIENYDTEFAKVYEVIQAQKEDLETKQNTLQTELTHTINELNKNLQALIQTNQENTEKEIARIDSEKTNRAELGQMLVQLGQQLIKD